MSQEEKCIFKEIQERKQPIHYCMENIKSDDRIDIILEMESERMDSLCLVIDESTIEVVKNELLHCSTKIVGIREFLKGDIVLNDFDAVIVYDAEKIISDYKKYKKYILDIQEIIERYRGCVFWYTSIYLNMRNTLSLTGARNVHEKLSDPNGMGMFGLVEEKSKVSFFDKLKNLEKVMSDELKADKKILIVTDKKSALNSSVTNLNVLEKRNLYILRSEEAQQWKGQRFDVDVVIFDFVDVLHVSQFVSNLIPKEKKIHLCIYVNMTKMDNAKRRYSEIQKRVDIYFQSPRKYVKIFGIGERDSMDLTYAKYGKVVLYPELNSWTIAHYQYLDKTGFSSTKEIYMKTICEVLGIEKRL